jgi:hypothetical protein
MAPSSLRLVFVIVNINNHFTRCIKSCKCKSSCQCFYTYISLYIFFGIYICIGCVYIFLKYIYTMLCWNISSCKCKSQSNILMKILRYPVFFKIMGCKKNENIAFHIFHWWLWFLKIIQQDHNESKMTSNNSFETSHWWSL